MFVIVAIVIGLIPAAIARSKGRRFGLWWLYGALLFIVALPHAILIKSDQRALDDRAAMSGMRKCPECAEMVRDDARVCRYCSSQLVPTAENAPVGEGSKFQPTPVAPGISGHDDLVDQWMAHKRK